MKVTLATPLCAAHPSRRHVVTGLALGVVAGGCRGAAAQVAASVRGTQSLSRFGIDRFASRDQWRALKAAFEAARMDGFDLVADPDADYRHDGPLELDGVSFDGRGCTFTALSDGPQVLRAFGSSFKIANLRLLGASITRRTDNYHNGLWIGGDERGQPATDFVVENVTVDGVAPGRGVATAGMMFSDAHRGHINRAVVRHSRADGIHCTYGSSDLIFDRPLSEATGDDGFAVVSYIAHGRVCRRIRTVDGVSRDSAARGFAVVGGMDVTYERPLVERSAAAGLYFFGEASFDTYGTERATAISPVLRDCVTGRGLLPDFSQGAITIGGRAGQDLVDDRHLARGAADCVVSDAAITGVGTRCWAAITLDEFAIRPRISDAVMTHIIPPPGSNLKPYGLYLGGRDMMIDRPRMTDVAGVAIVVSRTASGRCTVNAPRIDGSLLQGGPVNSVIYAENAPHLDDLIIGDGVFGRSPHQMSIALVPATKVHFSNNRSQ